MLELTAEEREVLARLELLAHGSTQRFDPTGSSDSDNLPHGISSEGNGPRLSEFPHLHWRDRILGARNDYSRRKALESAQEELQGWRRQAVRAANTPAESWDDLAARVVDEGRGWSVREVANHCRCSERQVVRARLNAGVSVDSGAPSVNGGHGSARGYKRGCRCENCRAAWAQQARERRAA